MQVFNTFFKVLKKKKTALIVYSVIFLVISFVLASSSDTKDKFKESKLNIMVIDEDSSAASKALTEVIAKKHDIKEKTDSADEMAEKLYWDTVDYVLVIKNGYENNLVSGSSDALFGEYHVRENYSTAYMTTVLGQYVKTARAYLSSGKALDEALTATAATVSRDTETSYRQNEDGSSENYSKTFSTYYRYMPYILLAVLMSVLGAVLTSMNRKDIRYRTDCSGINSRSTTLQIFGAAVVMVVCVWLFYVIAGMFLYGGIYKGIAWLAVLNSLVFTLVAAAIAVFISSLGLEENVFTAITIVVSLGMSFLCGIFVPLSVLGDSVAAVGRFLPGYWYSLANNMLCGDDPFEGAKFAGCLGIQLGFAAAMILLTLVVRRSRKNEALA